MCVLVDFSEPEVWLLLCWRRQLLAACATDSLLRVLRKVRLEAAGFGTMMARVCSRRCFCECPNLLLYVLHQSMLTRKGRVAARLLLCSSSWRSRSSAWRRLTHRSAVLRS